MKSTEAQNIDAAGEFTDELQAGTRLLQGQYVIESFLNSGGFGMTYLAKDSLDRTVVIKECFPASVCTRSENSVRARSRAHQKDFRSIVKLFLQEARQLAKLKHPNIVGVHQVFEDNETAYMALDFVDGLDMLDIIEENAQRISPEALRQILLQILHAVDFMHEQDILHRDISPDNILLDQTGSPVLIDFGAAREKAAKASRALSALLVVKDGYSPQEFYIAGSEQGRFSDLYALAASMYHLLTGTPPPNSQSRLAAIAEKAPDPYQSIIGQVKGFDDVFLGAIDTALNIFPKDRFQSAMDWIGLIDQDVLVEHALKTAQKNKEIDKSISILVTETNQAVHAARDLEKPTKKQTPIFEEPVSKLREKFAKIAHELSHELWIDENEQNAADGDVEAENFDTEYLSYDELSLGSDEDTSFSIELSDDDAEPVSGMYVPQRNGTDQAPLPKNWISRYLRKSRMSGLFWASKNDQTDNIGKAGQ